MTISHVLICLTLHTFQEMVLLQRQRREFCKSWGRSLGSDTQRAEEPESLSSQSRGGADPMSALPRCFLGLFEVSRRREAWPCSCPSQLARQCQKERWRVRNIRSASRCSWLGRKDTHHVWALGSVRLLGMLPVWTATRDSLTWQTVSPSEPDKKKDLWWEAAAPSIDASDWITHATIRGTDWIAVRALPLHCAWW